LNLVLGVGMSEQEGRCNVLFQNKSKTFANVIIIIICIYNLRKKYPNNNHNNELEHLFFYSDEK
jgi:hypothetical protein